MLVSGTILCIIDISFVKYITVIDMIYLLLMVHINVYFYASNNYYVLILMSQRYNVMIRGLFWTLEHKFKFYYFYYNQDGILKVLYIAVNLR